MSLTPEQRKYLENRATIDPPSLTQPIRAALALIDQQAEQIRQTDAALKSVGDNIIRAQRQLADVRTPEIDAEWEAYQDVLCLLVDAGLWREPGPEGV